MHAAVTTGSAGATRPSLRDGLTRYTWSPWCAGVLATIVSAMREHRDQRDTSIGVSGRHDFGVRSASFVGAAKPRCGALRPSHPISPRLVTIAKRPSGGPGRRQMCG